MCSLWLTTKRFFFFVGNIFSTSFFFVQLTIVVASLSFLYVLPLAKVLENASSQVEAVTAAVKNIEGYLNISEVVEVTFDIAVDTTFALVGKFGTPPVILTSFILPSPPLPSPPLISPPVIIPTAPLLSFVACIVLLIHMMKSVQ